MLWCRSHFVWPVFEGSIPTCTCFHSENLLPSKLLFVFVQDYLEAGADFVETNTFNGTTVAQSDYGTQHLVCMHIIHIMCTHVYQVFTMCDDKDPAV